MPVLQKIFFFWSVCKCEENGGSDLCYITYPGGREGVLLTKTPPPPPRSHKSFP